LLRPLEGLLVLPAVVLAGLPNTRDRTILARLVWASAPVFVGCVAGYGLTALVDALRYGDPLVTGYPPVWTQLTTPLLVGLAGGLVSPARGIIWAMPAVVLVPLGLRRLWHTEYRALSIGLIGACCALLLITAAWFAWWGGVNWGLRLFVPALPVLAVLAAIGVGDAPSTGLKRVVAALFVAGVVWAAPGVVTDILSGYAGLADGTEGSFRLEAYPPIGAWRYLKYPLPTQRVDTASIDIVWVRLVPDTDGRSLIPFGVLLIAGTVLGLRAWNLTRAAETSAWRQGEARDTRDSAGALQPLSRA
jgi:hypothetical protein